MGYVAKAKQDLEKAYQESGVMVIKDALDIISKYQVSADEGMPDFSIDEMQSDALKLTALNFTIQSFMVQLDANAGRAKVKLKFEKAKQFNRLKVEDIKKSDKRCENEAEEAVYQFAIEEIEARKAAQYLDVAWNRTVDMVNMLKKFVERMMWQGPQAT